MTDYVVKPSL